MPTKRQKNIGICLVLAVVLAVNAVGCSFIGIRKVPMDNIQEQNGFTILSQETKEVILNLLTEQLPSYDDIVAAEGARLELDDIPVFTTDTTEVFLHAAGVSGHKPEGTDKDVLYLGFDIRHTTTDAGTVYSVNRVMNENGSHTYSSVVSVTRETLQEYNRGIRLMGNGPADNFHLYIDAALYTTLQGVVNIGITLNEIVYERGIEVKIYGSESAEYDMSELDPEEQQNLPHQAIMENQSVLYDTLSQKEMFLTDWLKHTEYSVSKYTVIDLDRDANLETVLWLTHGTNEYVGFLILHSDAGKTYAHLLYYRQFFELKEDGTFSFSGGVSNHGFGEIIFNGDAYSISRIAYCESYDNISVSYYSERDSRALTKSEYESWEQAQCDKSGTVWYEWTDGQ